MINGALEVDVGEAKTRTVVSGLVDYISESELTGRLVVLLCNLKPSKLRGVESQAMLLCASDKENGKVEPLCVPVGCHVGERVLVEGFEDGAPDEVLNPKKKVWEKLQADLRTTDNRTATWKAAVLKTQFGAITSSSLVNVQIA